MKKRLIKKKKPAKKRSPKKKAPKKGAKRGVKKSSKRSTRAAARPMKAAKPIGRVTHFYNHIGVAIVKFSKPVSAGAKLHYKGATTDFIDTAKSLQYDHKEIARAPKGKQVGIKVKKRVREGDEVYRAEEK